MTKNCKILSIGQSQLMSYKLMLCLPMLCTLMFCSPSFAQSKLGLAVPYISGEVKPLVANEPVNSILLANISRSLVRSDRTGRLSPDLARSFQTSDDGRLWTFKLRNGLLFPNSRSATVKDVKNSLQLWQTQTQTASALDVSNIADIEEVSVKSPLQLRRTDSALAIKLREPDWNFGRLVAKLPITDPELSRGFGSYFGKQTFFSAIGPYQIRELSAERGATLERSPAFFEQGLTGSAVITIKPYEDAAAALSALRSGGVDIIPLPTQSQLEQIADDPTLIALDSPLLQLEPTEESWKPTRNYWSNRDDQRDRLLTSKIIVRKSLKLDEKAGEYFDLSSSFLP